MGLVTDFRFHVNESDIREVLTRTMDSSTAGAAAALEGDEYQPAEQKDFFRDMALTLVPLVLHPCPQTKVQCLLSHYCIFFLIK